MNKELCFKTILTLIIIATGIAIGYTNFVQAEIKEDVQRIENFNQKIDEKIDKINSQITDIKIILQARP